MAFRKTMYDAFSQVMRPIWYCQTTQWTTKRRVKCYRRKCSRNSRTIWE